jgi:hypothetical protein
VTVFASWNGATYLRSWQVLAGPSPSALRVVETVPRSGFETRIRVKGTPKFVAVRALGPDREELRESRARRVRR